MANANVDFERNLKRKMFRNFNKKSNTLHRLNRWERLMKKKRNVVPDEELLKRYLDLGDFRSLDTLSKKYLTIAFAYFSDRVFNHDDCDDLAQDTMLKIIKKINSGEKIANFFAYFSVCVRNMFRDYLRAKMRENNRLIFDNNDEGQNSNPDVEQIEADDSLLYVSEKEFIKKIEECLKKIPKTKDRGILRDYIYGYSLKEIAERNDCNSNTAASLWRRKKRDIMKCILGKLQT